VRNYINYYIAALAETKVAIMLNSLKIRSPNSSVGTNPSTVKLVRAKLLSRTYVPKFISTIVLATPTLWALLCGIRCNMVVIKRNL
jgi:hypothetical protein